MRTLVAFVVLIATASNVFAVNLYKCKTKDGTTIYQNDPCPQDTATVAKGGYQRQPDNTSNQQSAAAYSQQKHARLEYEAAVAAQQRTEQAASEAQLPVSSTDAWHAQVEANSYESRVGHDGPVRTKGQAAANPERAAQQATEEPITASTPNFDEKKFQPESNITDCQGRPGGAVDCYKSDGTHMSGNVGPTGSGDVWGGDGSHADISRNPLGQSTTDNGTCVRDQFGQCR